MHFFSQDVRKYIYGVLRVLQGKNLGEESQSWSNAQRGRRNYHYVDTYYVKHLVYVSLHFFISPTREIPLNPSLLRMKI